MEESGNMRVGTSRVGTRVLLIFSTIEMAQRVICLNQHGCCHLGATSPGSIDTWRYSRRFKQMLVLLLQYRKCFT